MQTEIQTNDGALLFIVNILMMFGHGFRSEFRKKK